MKTIYKYPIQITDIQQVEIPLMSKIIHAGLDPKGVPCVWAAVDPESELIPVKILVVGTGNPLRSHFDRHVGSFIQGPFVWHVFIG